MRAFAIFSLILTLFGCRAWSQTMTTNAPAATNAPAPANEPEKSWSSSLSVYTYILPDNRYYAQPTLTVDHDWLHLEARYNYEDLRTASLWAGYNFSGGEKLAWELTPMLGGAFGDTTGIAPGYKGSLSWWKLELYSEGEYLFDTSDSAGSFFYNWSELTLSPTEWFRFGLVTQRTHIYETNRDIQRGFLVGFSFKHIDLTTYVFNPDDRPSVVLGVGVNF